MTAKTTALESLKLGSALSVTRALVLSMLAARGDSSYSEALFILSEQFKPEGAVLFYMGAGGKMRAARRGAPPLILSPELWARLSDGLNDPVRLSLGGPWSWSGGGFNHGFCLSRAMTHEGSLVGQIVLGRDDRPWDDEESVLLSVSADFAAPIFAAHQAHERDEQARKGAEAKLREHDFRLRAFFSESSDMIYMSNEQDQVVSINSSGLKLLGFKNHEDVVHKPMSGFLATPTDRKIFLERLHKSGRIADYENIYRKSNGDTVFCLESASVFKDSGGHLLIQGISKDITKRVKAERDLWRATMELSQANEDLKRAQDMMVQQEKLASIGQLAAGVAHEINNPLGFLQSNYRTMKSFTANFAQAWKSMGDFYPEKSKQISSDFDLDFQFKEIETMERESDEGYARIMAIISSMKTLARMDSQEKRDLVSLNAIIESALAMARNEIKYVADVDKQLGNLPEVSASASEINQVLLNIFVNAAQAIAGQGRQDRGRIGVRSWAKSDSVYCEIVDDGPGIPPEHLSRVFDPFFTTKEPGKGTGLGLSISYDIIVNKHGGQLNVDSSPGKGARFTISLPTKP